MVGGGGVEGTVLQRLKNIGLRRQAASHLQHPRGPAEVSRLLSVSDARVWSVDMEEMSLMEEEGGRLSLLFTAAPVLREWTAAGGYNVKDGDTRRNTSTGHILIIIFGFFKKLTFFWHLTKSKQQQQQLVGQQCVYDETRGQWSFGPKGFHRKDRPRLQRHLSFSEKHCMYFGIKSELWVNYEHCEHKFNIIIWFTKLLH